MRETSKSILRRVHDTRFATRYFVGRGIDIGCGNDCLWGYRSLFPLMESCRAWDKEQGDAQVLLGVADNTYDYLHASHLLEHLLDPKKAIQRWVDVVRPMGHLVILVPDWVLYEHEQWPSRFNSDHKQRFTLNKHHTPLAHFIPDIIPKAVDILKLELLDATFMPQVTGDQTLGIGECAIEIILRKKKK